MEKDGHGRLPERTVYYWVTQRIIERERRVLINPDVNQTEKGQVILLANLTRFALSIGNPIAVHLGKELIRVSDPLMVSISDLGGE